MTTQFRAGDRVKMTRGLDLIETTLIEYPNNPGSVAVELTGNPYNGYYLHVYVTNGWKVEKLKSALPTTPGSVVKVVAPDDENYDNLFYMLDEDGDWVRYDQAYGNMSFRDSNWELVFDAGTVGAKLDLTVGPVDGL